MQQVTPAYDSHGAKPHQKYTGVLCSREFPTLCSSLWLQKAPTQPGGLLTHTLLPQPPGLSAEPGRRPMNSIAARSRTTALAQRTCGHMGAERGGKDKSEDQKLKGHRGKFPVVLRGKPSPRLGVSAGSGGTADRPDLSVELFLFRANDGSPVDPSDTKCCQSNSAAHEASLASACPSPQDCMLNVFTVKRRFVFMG